MDAVDQELIKRRHAGDDAASRRRSMQVGQRRAAGVLRLRVRPGAQRIMCRGLCYRRAAVGAWRGTRARPRRGMGGARRGEHPVRTLLSL